MDNDWFIQFNLDKEGNRKTNCLIDTDVMARLAQVTGGGEAEVDLFGEDRGKWYTFLKMIAFHVTHPHTVCF